MRLVWRRRACHLVFLPLPRGWDRSLLLCSALRCCVLCCAGILVWETCRRSSLPRVMFRSRGLGGSRCAGAKPLPSPCWVGTAWWEEVGQTRWWCWEHTACLSPPTVPTCPPLLRLHALSQDWTLHSLRGPNWALIRIWWRNSTPPAAEIPTCVIPNWTFWLSWLASEVWTLQRLCLCTPRNNVFSPTERERSSFKHRVNQACISTTKANTPPLSQNSPIWQPHPLGPIVPLIFPHPDQVDLNQQPRRQIQF